MKFSILYHHERAGNDEATVVAATPEEARVAFLDRCVQPRFITIKRIEPVLTKPQERFLAEIREAGEKRYNGRARKSLEALREAGLITYEFDLVPHLHGRYTELFTARPVQR